MKNNVVSRSSSSRLVRSNDAPTLAQFVRPSMNLALARARFAQPSIGALWNPNLLDGLRAPLTRFRD